MINRRRKNQESLATKLPTACVWIRMNHRLCIGIWFTKSSSIASLKMLQKIMLSLEDLKPTSEICLNQRWKCLDAQSTGKANFGSLGVISGSSSPSTWAHLADSLRQFELPKVWNEHIHTHKQKCSKSKHKIHKDSAGKHRKERLGTGRPALSRLDLDLLPLFECFAPPVCWEHGNHSQLKTEWLMQQCRCDKDF